MEDEDIIQDLKQFIATTVSQSEERITDDLGGRLDSVESRLDRVQSRLGNVESRLSNLETKVDTIQEAVADAISQSNESNDVAVQNHEQRLRRLEQRAA
jgi:predicted transcriptional regulator